MPDVVNWLLESDEPWTRYRTLVDLLDRLVIRLAFSFVVAARSSPSLA